MTHSHPPLPLPPDVLQGIEHFNRGAFYACHDSLEKAWIEEKGPIRKLYQGILQIGVALYHEARGNRRGATRLLQAGTDKLRIFSPTSQGIDITSLLKASALIQRYFTTHTDRLPAALHPVIRFFPSEQL